MARKTLTADAENALLGTIPDQQVARRLKMNVERVKAHRHYLDIPIFKPKTHRWTPDGDRLLSERPDVQVAMFLGITEGAVRHRRIRLGIARPGLERG